MSRFPHLRSSIVLGSWLLSLWTFLLLRPHASVERNPLDGTQVVTIRPDLVKTSTLVLRTSGLIDSLRYLPNGPSKSIRMGTTSLEIAAGTGKQRLEVHSSTRLEMARFADSTVGWLHALPLALTSAWLLYLLALRSGLPIMARWFGIGALLRFLYCIATPWPARAWDAVGHADFIRHILTEGGIPCAGTCWECYHPPFYYAVASLFWKAAALCSLPGESGAVLLGLACSLLLLWFGLEAFHKRLDTATFAPIGLLFAVWPPFLQQAGKINNDVFITLFSGLALHQAWNWTREKKRRHLFWCVLWCLLAVLSKGNGSLSVVLVAWVLFSGFPLATLRQGLKERLPFLLVIPFLLLATWFGSQRAATAHSGSELLVGNITQQAAGSQARPYGLDQLLRFDPVAWIGTPHRSSADLDSFWNSVGKDILTGQFIFPEDPYSSFGYPMLLLFSLLTLAMILSVRRWSRKDLEWLGGIVVCLAALFAFRTRYPFDCSLDVRYAPLLGFFFLSGAARIDPKWLGPLARWLGLAIAIAYFTPLLP